MRDVSYKSVFRPWMIVIGLIIIAIQQFHFINFTWDDPFITWRYAENLAKGAGLVFNEGERVEGYSNLLYVLIFALFYKLHIYRGELRLLYPAKILGAITSLGVIWVTLRYAAKLTSFRELSYPKAAIIIGVIAVINVYLHIWAMCGMETLLFPLLTMAGNLILIGAMESGGSRMGRSFTIAGIMFFLVSITRPDGFVIVFATLVFLFFSLRAARLPLTLLLQFVIAWAIPSLIVVGLRYSYYGDIFPLSYYSKATGGWPQIMGGFSQWWLGARTVLGSIIFYAAGFIPLFARKGRPGSAYMLIFIQAMIYQAYIVYSGFDWLMGNRFFTHILPQLELLASAGICEIFRLDNRFRPPLINERRFERTRLSFIVLVAVLVCVTSCLGFSGFYILRHGHFVSGYKNILDYISGESKSPWPDWMLREYYGAGIWLKQNSEPTDLVAIGDIGAIPYISGVQVLDCLGLTDAYIAKLPGDFFYEKCDVDYILGDKPGYEDRQPDFIILQGSLLKAAGGGEVYMPHGSEFSKHMLLLWDDDRFQERYELVYDKDIFLIFKRKDE